MKTLSGAIFLQEGRPKVVHFATEKISGARLAAILQMTYPPRDETQQCAHQPTETGGISYDIHI